MSFRCPARYFVRYFVRSFVRSLARSLVRSLARYFARSLAAGGLSVPLLRRHSIGRDDRTGIADHKTGETVPGMRGVDRARPCEPGGNIGRRKAVPGGGGVPHRLCPPPPPPLPAHPTQT